MLDAIDNMVVFLISVFFDLFIFILLLRALMQWAGVHYLNPFAQFVIKLTDWCVKPLRPFMPIIYRIDFSIVLLLLILEIIKYIIVVLLNSQADSIISVFILSLLDLIRLLLNIFFFAIIIRVIFSWLGQMPGNPIVEVVNLITEPLLTPARRLIPPIANLDISPLIVLILLQAINIFIGSIY